MPKRGDRLYKCLAGNLETVVFIQEQYLPGATYKTYTVRSLETSKKFVCSTHMYLPSEVEAYEDYERELLRCQVGLQSDLLDAKQRLEDCRIELARMATLIEAKKNGRTSSLATH